MARERYAAQVALLVHALPIIADEPHFALKGGTAINLFYRNMPRLSVDIDLTYVPLDERATALANIDAAFDRMIERARQLLSGVDTHRISGGGAGDTRLLLRLAEAEVKVEVSPVLRGTVAPPRMMRVTDAVEEAFGFAETLVFDFEDLYAGKLCAALDRQHPRDLYDVHLLYEHEGVTDDLFRTFLVYAACSGRPLHELIAPNRLAIDRAFAQEFDGMTIEHVPLATLLAARERLIEDIGARATGAAAEFLLSVHDAEPDFGLIGLPDAAQLPAIKWKLLNLRKLKDANPEKHADQRARLAAALRI
ncbi:nucleotidyl transferase AbiEii/AbiGii toxin family protein [Stakelama saccharophila]|uniref:Nucleotidyl transferase AbiEii/AbiGii toxin family protein n=1 Tax=Stakelama saccharophila TaxID=3075605 RepID=A0ABZ0B9Q9_9SPHN|nr:nucleotidyl transferase AbiEii/AbiGii toxin family protein [Stakelama sp. W311]WNO54119.1 nucleotidyl transferase AbiEii/AbiGii toxin family protein [Stakelama sp. W311]